MTTGVSTTLVYILCGDQVSGTDTPEYDAIFTVLESDGTWTECVGGECRLFEAAGGSLEPGRRYQAMISSLTEDGLQRYCAACTPCVDHTPASGVDGQWDNCGCDGVSVPSRLFGTFTSNIPEWNGAVVEFDYLGSPGAPYPGNIAWAGVLPPPNPAFLGFPFYFLCDGGPGAASPKIYYPLNDFISGLVPSQSYELVSCDPFHLIFTFDPPHCRAFGGWCISRIEITT